MNRKTGSIELLEMDNGTFSKNLTLEGFRAESKSNLLNKQDTVSTGKI